MPDCNYVMSREKVNLLARRRREQKVKCQIHGNRSKTKVSTHAQGGDVLAFLVVLSEPVINSSCCNQIVCR